MIYGKLNNLPERFTFGLFVAGDGFTPPTIHRNLVFTQPWPIGDVIEYFHEWVSNIFCGGEVHYL